MRAMRIVRLSSGSTFEDLAGYVRAVRVEHDGWAEVLVSGCTGFDYSSMTIAEDASAQVRQAFANVEAALATAGGGLEHLVRVRYFITDMGLWPELARIAGDCLRASLPAATCLVCGLIDPRMKVEIEADARIPGR
ncbi:MAG: RidA family protein [Caulobacteraceae bacterium]